MAATNARSSRPRLSRTPARDTGGRSRRSELPATLRRGDVDLDTVRVAELEEARRVGGLAAVHLAAALLERGHDGSGVIDGHADVVGAHGADRPVRPVDVRVGLQ